MFIADELIADVAGPDLVHHAGEALNKTSLVKGGKGSL
jgi:hypothetical protein